MPSSPRLGRGFAVSTLWRGLNPGQSRGLSSGPPSYVCLFASADVDLRHSMHGGLTARWGRTTIRSMVLYLFLIFTLVPIVELAILIRIGEATVWWLPVLLVISTGVAGALLSRWQGLRVYQRIRADAQAGRMPADALVDGFLILLAGILLITPGVLTDVVGIAFLIPPIRALVKRGVKAWIRRNVDVRVAGLNAGAWAGGNSAAAQREDEIIEARVIGTRVEDAG